jgi:hypothetical protein
MCAFVLPALALPSIADARHEATVGVSLSAHRFLPGGILRIWSSGAGRVRVSPDGINESGERQRVCRFTSEHPSGNSICTLHFTAGKRVVLRARPSPGSTFFRWSEACFRSNPCVVTARPPRAADSCCGDFIDVIATFNPVRLVVVRSGVLGETGFVTSSPAGISCPPVPATELPGDCIGVFHPARLVTLIAHSNGPVEWGFAFEPVGVGCFPGGGDPASKTCVARASNNFAGIGFGTAGPPETPTDHMKRLTVSRGGNKRGTVTGPDGVDGGDIGIRCGFATGSVCTQLYERGRHITLHAMPKAGAVFRRWISAPCAQGRRSRFCSFDVGSVSWARAVFVSRS